MSAWKVWVGAIALLLAVAVGAVALARGARPMAPTGDMAVTESYTRHAAEGSLLVGPYSRFQWHHPGPVFFYALAPFYAASGRMTAGLSAGAVAINVLMLVAAVGIAARAGGALFGAIVCAALTGFVLRIPDLLDSAWNPHVVVLPLAVTILAAAAAAAGDAWMLPVAAASASFSAQTHVGTLPVSLALGLLATLGALIASGRSWSWRLTWLPFAAAAVVALALWLPPIVEQFTHTPGNLTALWTFFAHGGGAGQPVRSAFLAWANMLSGVVRPGFYLAHGWIFRPARSGAVQALALAQPVLLAACAGVGVLQRRRFDACLAAVLVAVSLLSLWSASRIDGEVIDHEIFWVSVIGALNLAAIAHVVLRLAARGQSLASADLALSVVIAVLIVTCTGVAARRLIDVRSRSFAQSPEAAGIMRAAEGLRSYLAAERIVRPLVAIDQGSWSLAAGVLLQLQKQDVAYAVEDDWLPMFTDVARATGQEPVVVSVSGAARHVVLGDQPGVRSIVAADPVFVDVYRSNTNR